MNLSEKIRILCAKHGVSVSKLEQECGFGNGYISKLKDRIPSDRLQQIASFFKVPPEFLLNEIDPISNLGADEDERYYVDEQMAKIVHALEDNPDLKLLFELAKNAPPEDINIILQVLLALKRKERLQRYADGVASMSSKEDK